MSATAIKEFYQVRASALEFVSWLGHADIEHNAANGDFARKWSMWFRNHAQLLKSQLGGDAEDLVNDIFRPKSLKELTSIYGRNHTLAK